MEHPNIIRVDEFGENEGRYWLRMELAAGIKVGNKRRVSLQDYVDAVGGRIPQEELLPMLEQIISGLGYAHDRGANAEGSK